MVRCGHCNAETELNGNGVPICPSCSIREKLTLLFNAGKLVVGIYLGKSGLASAYGDRWLLAGLPLLGILSRPHLFSGRRIHLGIR